MQIDSEADLVTIEVVNRVKVPKESISNEEEIFILARESALVDHKVALTLIALVKVLLWVDFKDVVAHLETYWLYFRGDILARFLNVAKSFISFAVKFWQGGLPFRSDLLENIWRN
jgi:hypothetical protein